MEVNERVALCIEPQRHGTIVRIVQDLIYVRWDSDTYGMALAYEKHEIFRINAFFEHMKSQNPMPNILRDFINGLGEEDAIRVYQFFNRENSNNLFCIELANSQLRKDMQR